MWSCRWWPRRRRNTARPGARREIARLKEEMLKAAADLEFEKAAELRDRMLGLEKRELAVG